jgi:hypothetical protein
VSGLNTVETIKSPADFKMKLFSDPVEASFKSGCNFRWDHAAVREIAMVHVSIVGESLSASDLSISEPSNRGRYIYAPLGALLGALRCEW